MLNDTFDWLKDSQKRLERFFSRKPGGESIRTNR